MQKRSPKFTHRISKAKNFSLCVTLGLGAVSLLVPGFLQAAEPRYLCSETSDVGVQPNEPKANGYQVRVYEGSGENSDSFTIDLKYQEGNSSSWVGNAKARKEFAKPNLSSELGNAPGFPIMELPHYKASFYYYEYSQENGPQKTLVAQVYFENPRRSGSDQDSETLKGYVHTREYGGSHILQCKLKGLAN